jgi:hypothetical protein
MAISVLPVPAPGIMAKKLTARKVEQTRPNPSKRREIPDGGKPGLYLVIQPSGRKSWAVRCRVNGRPRKLTLDGFPGLATARRLAQDALDMIAAGSGETGVKESMWTRERPLWRRGGRLC